MASAVTMRPEEASAKGASLGGAVNIVVRSFLLKSHFAKLHSFLSTHWDSCHSLDAVVRLMRSHGVEISDEDQARFMEWGEERMIEQLVLRMPSQTREQFEHFFLQLSLLTLTTTRLREALVSGNPKAMEEVLNEADKVGITPYIIKMAVVQAGKEVTAVRESHNKWMVETDEALGPLLRSQVEAMATHKKLLSSQAELGNARAAANQKSKKVLMGIAGGQGQALVNTSFMAWADHVRHMRVENEIRKEYEEEIERAEQRLLEYKETQLSNVRGVLTKKAAANDLELVALCFRTFVADVEEAKSDRAAQAEVRDLELKLTTYANETAANTKKVVARMNADSEAGLVSNVFTAFKQYHMEYQKDKLLNDEVKKAEQRVNEFKKKQKDGAGSVMNRMAGASGSGALAMIMTEWVNYYVENKREAEMAAEMEAQTAKFASITGRNKDTGGSAMIRAADVMNHATLIPVWHAWRIHASVIRMKQNGENSYKWRKEQLHNVKKLFHGFANDLENTLNPRDGSHMSASKEHEFSHRRKYGDSRAPSSRSAGYGMAAPH